MGGVCIKDHGVVHPQVPETRKDLKKVPKNSSSASYEDHRRDIGVGIFKTKIYGNDAPEKSDQNPPVESADKPSDKNCFQDVRDREPGEDVENRDHVAERDPIERTEVIPDNPFAAPVAQSKGRQEHVRQAKEEDSGALANASSNSLMGSTAKGERRKGGNILEPEIEIDDKEIEGILGDMQQEIKNKVQGMNLFGKPGKPDLGGSFGNMQQHGQEIKNNVQGGSMLENQDIFGGILGNLQQELSNQIGGLFGAQQPKTNDQLAGGLFGGDLGGLFGGLQQEIRDGIAVDNVSEKPEIVQPERKETPKPSEESQPKHVMHVMSKKKERVKPNSPPKHVMHVMSKKKERVKPISPPKHVMHVMSKKKERVKPNSPPKHVMHVMSKKKPRVKPNSPPLVMHVMSKKKERAVDISEEIIKEPYHTCPRAIHMIKSVSPYKNYVIIPKSQCLKIEVVPAYPNVELLGKMVDENGTEVISFVQYHETRGLFQVIIAMPKKTGDYEFTIYARRGEVGCFSATVTYKIKYSKIIRTKKENFIARFPKSYRMWVYKQYFLISPLSGELVKGTNYMMKVRPTEEEKNKMEKFVVFRNNNTTVDMKELGNSGVFQCKIDKSCEPKFSLAVKYRGTQFCMLLDYVFKN